MVKSTVRRVRLEYRRAYSRAPPKENKKPPPVYQTGNGNARWLIIRMQIITYWKGKHNVGKSNEATCAELYV